MTNRSRPAGLPSRRRRALSIAVAAAPFAAAMPRAARAQAYPDRPIRMVVPFPPGGALDVLGRQLAQKMGEDLGQQMVVENRPGATGHVGGEFVARSKPDGYTLLFTASSTQAVSPHLMKLAYRPIEDFAPISLAATVNNVVVVTPSLPVNSMAELIAYAKSNPDRISYGSFGVGSNLHLAGEMLNQRAGTRMRHVPYTSPQLIPDLLAGRIQLHVANIPDVAQHIADGKLRPLAVTSAQKLPDYPNLPTVAETLPGYEVGAWGMLLAPAGTPNEIVARLNASTVKSLNSPELRESFAKLRFNAAPMSPERTAEFLRSESAKWGAVVKEAGVPPIN